jgi:c-di-GMP-binding flagellar brake protein YcgR
MSAVRHPGSRAATATIFEPGQRRRNVRATTNVAAPAFHYQLAHPFVARVRDLSLGGALIEADRDLPLGGSVRLRITAEQPSLDVTLLAEVVRRCEGGAYGLRFEDVGQAEQIQLLRYVLWSVRRAAADGKGAAALPGEVAAAEPAQAPPRSFHSGV